MRSTTASLLFAAMALSPFVTQAQPLESITVQTAYADFGKKHPPKDDVAAFVRGTFAYDLGWQIKPVLGIGGFAVGNIYPFAGVERVFRWNDFSLTPVIGAGLYKRFSPRGSLGHPLEFREELTAAYHFTQNMSIGATVGHMSNASLGKNNPGVNTFGISLRRQIPSF